MATKIDQSNSSVRGDQVAGDKNIINIEITKELAPAIDPIRIYGTGTIDADTDNTILLRKLKDGEFNKNSIDMAIRCKAEYLKTQIEYNKTEEGRGFLKDMQQNLLTIINTKYISQMKEGETLKTSLTDIADEFTRVVNKYRDVIHIDESFVEGMLYMATSECALNWKIEGEDDEI